MNEQVAKYRQLYVATRDAILTGKLSKPQISAFQTQLNELKPVALSGLNQKLGQAYLDLVSEKSHLRLAPTTLCPKFKP
jgi:hypothetical protein